MRPILKRVALVGVAALTAIQFVPAVRSNPPVTADLVAPPAVRDVLQRVCFDCHSNETVWPWYAWVQPMAWLVSDDVEEGREHLNFSEWGSYSPGRQAHKAEEVWDEVSQGEMPLWFYVPLHPDAELSEADKTVLAEWSRSFPAVEEGEGRTRRPRDDDEGRDD